jgi:hypothetical protein
MNYSDKKELVKRINNIKSKKCYIEIFKIIYLENSQFTKNNNGILFNLLDLEDEIILKIENIITFYEKKKHGNINQINN